jgi:hypothetical protein
MATLHERIASMVRGGASLDRVDRELIEPTTLSADQKAALWLYAWLLADARGTRAAAGRGRLAAEGLG